MTLAFVLNFDAELELEGGPRYQPTASVASRVVRLASAMKPSLPHAAVVLHPLDERAEPDTMAIAWCPTPRALRVIDAAGLSRPRDAPSLEVLRRVNDRRFAAALGDGELDGATLVHDADAARDALARPGEWLLKRCFGVSGRGQRRVHGGDTTPLDLAFVSASLRKHGALVIEPRVHIERELSVHAWQVGARTHVRSIRSPFVDALGAFVRSAPAEDVSASVRDALETTTHRVGAALDVAGYHGPFGVDAFLHRDAASGTIALRTLSEINARYCMGWDDDDGWLAPSG